jgi:hypothetical protein
MMSNDFGVKRELFWRLGCSVVVCSGARAAIVVVWMAVLGSWLSRYLALAKHIFVDYTTDSHRSKHDALGARQGVARRAGILNLCEGQEGVGLREGGLPLQLWWIELASELQDDYNNSTTTISCWIHQWSL